MSGIKRSGAALRSIKEAKERMPMICHYCKNKADTIDHIIPWTMCRSSLKENLVPACRKCNGDKDNHLDYCSCAHCTFIYTAFL